MHNNIFKDFSKYQTGRKYKRKNSISYTRRVY